MFSFRHVGGFKLVLWWLWCWATFHTNLLCLWNTNVFRYFKTHTCSSWKFELTWNIQLKMCFWPPLQRGLHSKKTCTIDPRTTWTQTLKFMRLHGPPSYLSPKSFTKNVKSKSSSCDIIKSSLTCFDPSFHDLCDKVPPSVWSGLSWSAPQKLKSFSVVRELTGSAAQAPLHSSHQCSFHSPSARQNGSCTKGLLVLHGTHLSSFS